MEFNNLSLDQFIKEHDMHGYDIGKRVVLLSHYQVIIKDLIENIWQRSRVPFCLPLSLTHSSDLSTITMRPFGKLFAAAAANVLNLTGSHVKKNYQKKKKKKKKPEQPHEEMTMKSSGKKEPGAAPKNLSEKLTWENLVEDFAMICDNNYKKIKNSHEMYCEVLKWRDTIYATQKSHNRGADGILATIVAEGSADGVAAVVGSIVVANTGAKDDVPYIMVHLCNPFNRKNWVNS
ncbi:hypothetical protein GBA52_008276 [Prunus armeniaca]|nr:hypothetical protein GBA52_008276 [Prunus armeniaca]